MTAEQSRPVAADPPPTFSLRTMFLFVTCFGIVCAAFRIAGAEDGIWLAAIFVIGFLTVWFFITGRRSAARNLCAALLGLLFIAALSNSGVRSRPVSPRGQCANNIRQISLALFNYHQQYGSFPPAYVTDAHGKPLYSWRVAILPFLEENNLFKSFHREQAWDSPANMALSQTQVPMYQCPAEQYVPAMTEYVAVVGPNTAWPGAKCSKLADFKGPSKTILVIETANAGIHWAEPRDLYVGQMAAGVNPKTGQGISSQHQGGVNAVFADGHVEFIPDDIDPKQLARMLEINPTDEAAK